MFIQHFFFIALFAVLNSFIYAQEIPPSDVAAGSSTTQVPQQNILQAGVLSLFRPDIDDKLAFESISAAPERVQVFASRLMRRNYSGPKPKRLLLHGPAGSGKTTIATALAKLASRECYVIHGPAIGDQYQNSGAQDLKAVADTLSATTAPCILVIDEIAALTGSYGEKYNSHDSKTTEALWLLLDACDHNPNVMVVATTNYIDKVPKQLKDRFKGSTVEIPLPEYKHRRDLIASYLPKDHQCTPSELMYVARWTSNLSVRAIKSIVQEAIAYAADGDESVCYEHLNKAMKHHGAAHGWFWWIPSTKDMAKEEKEHAWDVVKFAVPTALTVIGMCLSYWLAYDSKMLTITLQNDMKNFNKEQNEDNKKFQRELNEDNKRFNRQLQQEGFAFQLNLQNQSMAEQKRMHDENMAQQKLSFEEQQKSGFWNKVSLAFQAGVAAFSGIAVVAAKFAKK